MNRLTLATPWLFAAAAAVFLVRLSLTADLPDPWWRAVIIGVGIGTALFGRLVVRMPVLFVAAMMLASARLASLSTTETGPPTFGVTWLPATLDIIVGLGLCLVLAVSLCYRRGAMCRHDIIDILAITIGASTVTWLTVTNLLIDEQGLSTGLAIVASAYLPISVLILTFTIDVMYTGLTRNRTMQFVVAAAVANIAATLIRLLFQVEVLPTGARVFSVGTYAVAFLLLCAGFTHLDGPGSLKTDTRVSEYRHDSKTRLIIMAMGLIAPVTAIALIAPTSPIDAVVRTTATLALVVTIVVRLSISMRDHAIARQTLLQKVNRDDLTGLPTRTRFVESVADVLETTWRSEQQPTIIQLNLDRFKNINDSLGHVDANQVLVIVAERLTETAASFDGVVARSGGDEFVIVDGTSTSAADAMMRVESVREALTQPITVADSTLFITASIGVAVTPRNRTISAEDLMRRAHIASHRAKAAGRNRVSIFDDSMQAHLTRRMDVENALHGAIGRKEMQLYHQPIVDIVSGRVSGFEALIRWQRPDGRLVSPGDFIPIAEETGIICELGAWALTDAFCELRGWIDAGVVAPTTTMSVNVSPRQIADPNFAEVVHDALARSGVSPNLLWIEMTESMMIDEPELAQSTLQQIRSMGVRIALDDFGTGFSSLSLLQQFPIQRIKIDRAFVQGVSEQGNDRSLVRTIIAMAQSMGLDLVAEGIETVQQLQSLRDMGCDKAQGYLISRPVPAGAMGSTMAALDELQSLTLFGSVELGRTSSMKPAGEPTEHTAPPESTVPMMSRTITGPIGNMGSRPLGQPAR